ncbi:ADP-ribosylglycohydrolase family protein [Aureimonas ureilytica]|uniref:ADP-ribosylglycohydrolase family protein n=1 Tax=Aureimonas ureilytica TaxID=401562 RepID=UPI0003797016|nr:ADP-ribosylglycohydrolase family protein [Aureimonas ureilytica]
MTIGAPLSCTVGDRARGALLGLAVGDALGTTLEFSARDSLPLQTEITGGGPFALSPGQWTDDTAMALALGHSLLARDGFDPSDLMTRFVSWWREGRYSCTSTCFDIGAATARALARFEAMGDPFAGSTDPREAGNGSLMRLAPAVLFALDDADLADRLAAEQSRTTHRAPQAVEACVVFARFLRSAILGEPDPLRAASWPGDSTIAAIAAGDWRTKDRDAIRSSGYVVHTLEAALWATARTQSFEEALILAVNLGEDADTVGAVTGQIAGALHGASAIPARWLDRLAWREEIETVADRLIGRGRE